MSNSYTGHGPNTGGLQQHSIGGVYPKIIYAQQTQCGLRWGVLDARTGGDSGPFAEQCAEAVALARSALRLERAKERVSAPAFDTSHVRSGADDPIPVGSQLANEFPAGGNVVDPFQLGRLFALRAARFHNPGRFA